MTHSSRRKTLGWTRLIGAFVTALTLGLTALSTVVHAQVQPVPPEHYTLDPRGVDLITGKLNYTVTEAQTGSPGSGGIAYSRLNSGRPVWRDLLMGSVTSTGSTYTVSIGAQSELFTRSGSTFTPQTNSGSTLTQSGGDYTYTAGDGSVATFHTYAYDPRAIYPGALIQTMTLPSGEVRAYGYEEITYCSQPGISLDPEVIVCNGETTRIRLADVTNNAGANIHYAYRSNAAEDAQGDWDTLLTVSGETSITYNTYTPSQTTDDLGRVTEYAYDSYGISRVRRPGSSVDDLTVTRSGDKVSRVVDASGQWDYGWSTSGSVQTTTVTGPLGQSLSVVADLTIGRATSVTNALSQTTTYAYDSQRRLSRIVQPEGDATDYAYDSRGNVTQVTNTPKPGSGLSTIVTSAAYPSTCANMRTCNQPTSTTDARGGVTDYAYDASHGGVTSVTQPAPTSGAVRPQTRVSYTTVRGIVVPSSTSACATLASCIGTADEVRTTLGYVTGTYASPTDLLPRTITSGSGDGSLAATSTFTYGPLGQVATVDGPLAGASDLTQVRFNAAAQVIGMVGPDPDGGGPLLNRAVRATLNARGQVAVTEAGTTTGYGDPAWAAFSVLQRQVTEYDVWGRPVVGRQQDAGGNTLALQQVGYDAAGRPECSSVRMNPWIFASPPSSACSITVGVYGPDRISRTSYDSLSRPIFTADGYGTATTINQSASYTANGLVQSMTDGNGNVSVMDYDGFDRLGRTRFPDAAGGSTSYTDYEGYGYDAAGNVIWSRTRAGETEATTFDALNRPTLTVRSNAPSTAITYDLLSRPLGVSGNSIALGYGWDALSRNTSQTGPLGTVGYGYDLAGRRTAMSWPDGFWVAYDWNLGNDLTAVRENGGLTLASIDYDNRGRRITTSRANGTATGYAYDGISRLAGMNNDVAGTAQDVSWTYGYNPASQITSRVSNNALYNAVPSTGTQSSAINGLNQVTAVNGQGLTYDTNQNLTGLPGSTYGFDGLNRLTSATGSSTIALTYDPVDRLAQSSGTYTWKFLYDGAQLIAEYDGAGNLARRFVPGLGMDDPVLAYEGSSTSDRRWMLADERGSIVAYTNGAGSVLSINTYDEYGVPGPNNAGRFQYTGQMYLPEAGLYHYRARAYLPQLGRFLQPDPIGYGDGMNMYGYVGGDPINLIDPSGLGEVCYNGAGCGPIEDVVIAGSRLRSKLSGGGAGFGLAGGGGCSPVFSMDADFGAGQDCSFWGGSGGSFIGTGLPDRTFPLAPFDADASNGIREEIAKPRPASRMDSFNRCFAYTQFGVLNYLSNAVANTGAAQFLIAREIPVANVALPEASALLVAGSIGGWIGGFGMAAFGDPSNLVNEVGQVAVERSLGPRASAMSQLLGSTIPDRSRIQSPCTPR